MRYIGIDTIKGLTMDRKNQKVYLDYAATTPVKPEVVAAMMPYFRPTEDASELVGNASRTFEKLIGAEPGTVRFNSGGSYGNNEIIKSFAHSNLKKGKHLDRKSVV